MRLSAVYTYLPRTLRRVGAATRVAEELGYERLWLGESSWRIGAIPAFAALGQRYRKIGFGTAVTLMQLRHPLQAAFDARSVSAVTGGRFALGLGVSDPELVEGMLGLKYERPHEYAREYLTIVKQAIRDQEVSFDGRRFSVHAELAAVEPQEVAETPVMLGALSEQMARVAGEVSDGCITWTAPADYIARLTVPAVSAGAEAAGRARPPILSVVHCAATTDAQLAVQIAERAFGSHIQRPHYAKMLERVGLLEESGERIVTPELMDALLVWGDKDRIAAGLARYRDAGVDELLVAAYFAGDEPARHFVETLTLIADAPR